jgi:peroxiredoxin Q/BCP
MLEAGEAAPDFTLPDQDGRELTLSDLRGETVVLYFYPRADTAGPDSGRPRVGIESGR